MSLFDRVFLIETDDEERNLERRANAGDKRAEAQLRRMRERSQFHQRGTSDWPEKVPASIIKPRLITYRDTGDYFLRRDPPRDPSDMPVGEYYAYSHGPRFLGNPRWQADYLRNVRKRLASIGQTSAWEKLFYRTPGDESYDVAAKFARAAERLRSKRVKTK